MTAPRGLGPRARASEPRSVAAAGAHAQAQAPLGHGSHRAVVPDMTAEEGVPPAGAVDQMGGWEATESGLATS